MAQAGGAVILAFAVCCLLVATALAVPEDGNVVAVRDVGPQRRSSLLCIFFRCGDEPADAAGSALVARGSSGEEPAALNGWGRPAVAGKAEVEDEEVGDVGDDGDEPPYDSDSGSDWDSDDDDEGGVVGWFWRLARRF